MHFIVIGVKPTGKVAPRFLEEAQKLGHFIDFVVPGQLRIYASNKRIRFKLSGLTYPIDHYDLIYTLSISDKRKKDWFLFLDYVRATYGITVIYEKYADPYYKPFLTPTYDYVVQHQNKIPFPKTVVFFNQKGAVFAAKKIGFPAILKINAPGMTRKGIGVRKVESLEQLKNLVLEYKPVANRYVLREFIPNNGDIRVFTVGYKAIGAMYRRPKPGDFRSNISQGGSGEPFDLKKHPQVQKIAEKLSKLMRAQVAGVDVILHAKTGKPYVLEINHGPQFAGLEKYAKVNAAREIIKYWEKMRKKDKLQLPIYRLKRKIYKLLGGNALW